MKEPQLLEYSLSKDVRAFSTTRHGGVSKGSFGEFNINPFCGDNIADVVANRHLLANTLSIDDRRIILPHQVHTAVCRSVDNFPNITEEELEGVDALTTSQPGLCIGVSTADCIPVLLYDEEHHAAAAIHAGWRGTVQRIVAQTVAFMHEKYKTQPEHLRAIVGPGISLKGFEVGQEVYDSFASAGFDMAAIAKKEAKWHIDLPLCNKMQLMKVGVAPDNITMSGICTWSDPKEFFSARRLGAASGRIYTAIMIL